MVEQLGDLLNLLKKKSMTKTSIYMYSVEELKVFQEVLLVIMLIYAIMTRLLILYFIHYFQKKSIIYL